MITLHPLLLHITSNDKTERPLKMVNRLSSLASFIGSTVRNTKLSNRANIPAGPRYKRGLMLYSHYHSGANAHHRRSITTFSQCGANIRIIPPFGKGGADLIIVPLSTLITSSPY